MGILPAKRIVSKPVTGLIHASILAPCCKRGITKYVLQLP